MDPALAKPFIKATKDVLAAMASLEVVAGTPYIKKDKTARGDVSAVIGIALGYVIAGESDSIGQALGAIVRNRRRGSESGRRRCPA